LKKSLKSLLKQYKQSKIIYIHKVKGKKVVIGIDSGLESLK
jgi:hypothetical protein